MAVFPIGMALSSHQYFAFKIWSRTSKLVSVLLRAPGVIQIYQVLGFAGFCGRFADFCGRFAGNFGRRYVHVYALVLGI